MVKRIIQDFYLAISPYVSSPAPFSLGVLGSWCTQQCWGVECTVLTVCLPKTHPVSDLLESRVDRDWKTPGWHRPWFCTNMIQVLPFFLFFFFEFAAMGWHVQPGVRQAIKGLSLVIF